MTPGEYIDAAKAEMGIETDYEFAKRLDIAKQRISDIRKGTRPVDNYLALKLASVLNLDLSELIADLEAQREKDEKKREFFRGFLQKHSGLTAHLSLYGVAFAVIHHFSKLLELAQLST